MSEAESSSAVAEADKKVLQSRVEAYQHTCHVQGSKLTRMECLLFAESDQAKAGQNISMLNLHQLTFTDETLRAFADVMKEKT